MTEVMHDAEHGSIVLNESLVDSNAVMKALSEQHPEVAALAQWAGNLQPTGGQRYAAAALERDKFVLPAKIFDQFRVAFLAVDTDDIVSGVLETTESLALSRMDFEAEDQDEENIWNQIAQDLDLDSRLREMWRELFTYSQYSCGIWWGRKSYKVKGKTQKGVTRKKTFTNLVVPLGLTLLDPLKIIPVGSFLFNQEQLVYVADKNETSSILNALNSPGSDPLVNAFLTGPYEPHHSERGYFSQLGIQSSQHLFLCNPNSVWRHTETRPAYQKFASLRMKSVFELLDLKQQLKQMDRAQLLGGTNFIILITKGTDEHPARPGEVESLQTQIRTVARVPIIVGDHRLDVKIITPSNDQTLRPERYNALDSRITARLYQMFMLGNYCQSEDTEILTSEGWKRHSEVSVGDRALTLNPETMSSEWDVIEKVNRFQHDGPVYEWSARTHSSISTPNHRWLVQNRRGQFVWKYSAELTAEHGIPLSVPGDHAPTEPTFSDPFVRLMAWFWTEGYWKQGWKACISQSPQANPVNCAAIKDDLVQEFGVEGFSSWKSGTFALSAEASGQFTKWTEDHKRPLIDFILRLTDHQLNLFIETAIDGDGCRSGDKVSFFQKNEGCIRFFEFVCALAGRATRTIRHNEDIWRVTLLKTRYVRPVAAASMRGEDGLTTYQGVVWCPTTRNGTWLARHDGHVFWTGNSAGGKGDDSVKLARVVARGMESRRHMMRRSLEAHVFRPTVQMNSEFTSDPDLRFHPKRVALDFDQALAAFLLDLRDRGDISRDSILSEFDFSQEEEARKREREAEQYDEIFQTAVPYSGNITTDINAGAAAKSAPGGGAATPNIPDHGHAPTGEPVPLPQDSTPQPAANKKTGSADTKSAGRRQGGTKSGGGSAPGTGQGQAPRNPRRKSK